MTALRLSDVAPAIGARHVGADARFERVSSDTRTLRHDDLFVALRGEHFDGHDYLPEAANAGACGALVERDMAVELPLLVVDDSRLGLGRLARHWRERHSARLVAITGSNGKTTVKEMLAAILAHAGEVLATQGNLNNDIGVPLTLLRLDGRHRFAVVEMGANHPGEIAYLTSLAQPDVAVITNAGPAHLEGFGSIDGVARAKGEIYAGLRPGGVAVVNADDPRAPVWYALTAGRTVLRFGLDADCEVRGHWKAQDSGARLVMHTPAGEVEVRLPLPGRHNGLNALAATAAALGLDVPLPAIKAGLESLTPVKGRLQLHHGGDGLAVLDDTYNANPASLAAALRVLMARPGARWVVLGDMLELGDDAAALHAQAGRECRDAGVERLFTVGPLSAAAAEAFGAGAAHFEDWQVLVDVLRDQWRGRTGTVLVKGSRSMHLEQVVSALLADPGAGER